MAKIPSSCGVAIVGAGPVGALLSLFLARRGIAVDVFERRGDIRKGDGTSGRSINLNLSVRGLAALRHIGLDTTVLAGTVPMTGRLIHQQNGEIAYQAYGRSDSEHGNSVSRSGLNRLLIDEAEASGKVRFHFNARVCHCDIATGKMEIEERGSGAMFSVSAETIFATDGSASAIRQAMREHPSFSCTTEPLDYGYKELTVAPGPFGQSRMKKEVLHIWPRGRFMLIALPNLDGSFTSTLFLPLAGENSFDALREPAQVRNFFAEYFADFTPLIADLEEAFLGSPTGHMETIKCCPWTAAGRVLLLGDAAHAVVPFYGQGMNAGFEDLMVLDACIDQHFERGDQLASQTAWARVFDEFSRWRKEHTDAIADMAIENFLEMRDKCAEPRFLMERAVERILERRFPGEYVSRYALVTFTNVPYAIARRAGEVTEAILAEVCVGIGRPEDVDLARAQALIQSWLMPILKDFKHVLQAR